MSILAVAKQLERIDWDFPGSGNDPGSIHKAHWFPGNFIPQIPSVFIQTLSRAGDLVLDPFAGSGTTGIVAAQMGRRAHLSDRLLACTMICEGKLALCQLGSDNRWKSQVVARLTWENQCRLRSPGQHGEGGDPALEKWYSVDTLQQLRYLWHLVEIERDKRLAKVLRLVFSDVLFACASPGAAVTASGKQRRHHWGWVADNVCPNNLVNHNAIRMFVDRVLSLTPHPQPIATDSISVIQDDARRLTLSSSSVDLIVTSPPYVSVIDYTHANRMLYLWMGWPILDDRESEIGARYKRKRLSAVSDYFTDMQQCAGELYRVLRPDGFCAVVLGESRNNPGVAKRVLSYMEEKFDLIWGPMLRQVSRQRVAERSARDAVEHLCVFRKRR